jgi:hypothetical protein
MLKKKSSKKFQKYWKRRESDIEEINVLAVQLVRDGRMDGSD